MSLPLWLSPPSAGDDGPVRSAARPILVMQEGASDPLTEPGFARRLRAGEPDAFDTLFSATYVALVRFAIRLGQTTESAEDLVMEVFRRVWERRAEWRPDDARVYLFGAVRHAAATAARDRRTRDVLLERAGVQTPGMAVSVDTPETSLESDERLRALADAVQHLPERQRLVFTLRREQGLSNAQVAIVLGIAMKTVEKDLTTAFKTLRAVLAPYRENT